MKNTIFGIACALLSFSAQSESRLAMITDVSITPIVSGDDNVESFELNTTIMLGANACLADNHTAELIVEPVETVLEAFVIIDSINPEKVCNRMYRPVYVELSTEVKMDKTRSLDLLILNVQIEDGTKTISYRDVQ